MSEPSCTTPPSRQSEDGHPLTIIAGPCSAESRDQLLATAEALIDLGLDYFRAGLWKPRTRPGAFEGVGAEGLDWLAEVKMRTAMPVMTEVSLPQHIELALPAGVDAFWIGARTVSDPFAVQSLADALRGSDIPLFIKNPISPDLDLWIGAIERFARAGLSRLTAVFRGFSPYYTSKLSYRNTPSWSIAFELRRLLPNVPIIADPSHITGRRKDVADVCKMAVELGFEGVMVETHITPEVAKSDAAQQITPHELAHILATLEECKRDAPPIHTELDTYRKLLAEIDEALLATLARRMEVAREIGRYKREHQIPVLQMEYFSQVLEQNKRRARAFCLPEDFVYHLYTDIHELSTQIQLEEATLPDAPHPSPPPIDNPQ